VQSTFINSRFQLPDLDLYLDFSIQIMGILMSGVLIQSNASFRKKPSNVRLDAIPQYRLKKRNKYKTNQPKKPRTNNGFE